MVASQHQSYHYYHEPFKRRFTAETFPETFQCFIYAFPLFSTCFQGRFVLYWYHSMVCPEFILRFLQNKDASFSANYTFSIPEFLTHKIYTIFKKR